MNGPSHAPSTPQSAPQPSTRPHTRRDAERPADGRTGDREQGVAVFTHTAPYTRENHSGTAATCTEYPCAPRREALAILRETDPRTPAEQAAVDAVDAYRWVPLHAADYGHAIVLLLSRAGLLRDKAYEKHLDQARTSDGEYRSRIARADATALRQFGDLVVLAADLLDGGTDPAQVAAQLRDLSAQITERRDRLAAVTAPAGEEREAISA